MDDAENVFVVEDMVDIKERGILYCGKMPFYYDKNKKEDRDRVFNQPWDVISEDTFGRKWRITAMESKLIALPISAGEPMAIFITEWIDD